MAGTVKQIAYANDIIAKTIARIEAKIAAGNDTDKWEMAKKSMSAYAPETAAEVIDFEKEMGWFSYMEYAVANDMFIMN